MADKYLDLDKLSYFWSKISALLGNKVDKVSGKGLSTNDFTDSNKTALNNAVQKDGDRYLSGTFEPKTNYGANLGSANYRFNHLYAKNVNGSALGDAAYIGTPIPIANGGTGSTSPEDARLALGFKVVNKTINLKNKVFNKSSAGSYYLPEASATTVSELTTICSIVIYGTAYLRNEYFLIPRTIGSANKVGFMMSYITSGTLPDTITISDNLMIDLRIFGIV